MRTILMAFLAAGSLAAAALAEDKKEDKKEDKEPAVREIALVGFVVKLERGDVTMPTKIDSREEAEKVLGKHTEQVKGVNFDKEKLLLFTWSGSGGDRLTAVNDPGEKPAVVFSITRGLTKDLRSHVKLFAIPRAAEWRFAR